MATQAETQRGLNLAKTRDWLAIAAAVAVVIGALAAGIQWAVSSAVAPLYAEMRGLNSRMDGLGNRMDGLDKRMDGLDKRMDRMESRLDNHSGILAELRERLTRVETILLERDKETP